LKLKLKKKKKKKKKKKDKHSSEEFESQNYWEPEVHSGLGWGWNSDYENTGYEVAGWLGPSGLASNPGGFYELEFFPGELLQKLVTLLGILAIVAGPSVMILLFHWLLSNKSGPYIFNGRSLDSFSSD